jgi:hypothetical protein
MANFTAERDMLHFVGVARVLFGGTRKWVSVLWIVGFWVAVNLTSSAFYDLEQAGLQWRQLPGLALVVVVWGLVRKVRRAAGEVKLVYIVKRDPPPCKVLIVFLSPPRDLAAIQAIPSGSLSDTTIEAFQQSPWRMPMVAIRYHLGRLEKVVVVPTRDSAGKQDGTYRLMEEFRETVRRFTAAVPKVASVVAAGELEGPQTTASALAKGVAYEDAVEWLDVLHHVFACLHAGGYADGDIMVDVTGASKAATVAGAAVTVGDFRRIQYVSPVDYRVLSFDLNYAEETV